MPTGMVADTWGRRRSYLLGAATLLVSTLLYLFMWRTRAPFWGWALASVLLGLGFTFFSGATEAWLVDALAATGFQGKLETVMAKGQIASGIAMLAGTVGGGVVAQLTNVGVPYVLRSVLLGVLFVTAFFLMKDLGFTPAPASTSGAWAEVRLVIRHSLDQGWRNPPVRWLMLAAPFSAGVSMYAFYALQPYLLQLYGDQRAFGVAGLAAALIAGDADRLGVHCAFRATSVRAAHERVAGGDRRQLRLPGLARRDAKFLGGAGGGGADGADLVRGPAAAPGVPERHHPVGATGNGVVVRQPDGLGGGRGVPACARAGGGCLGVRADVPGQRDHPDGGDSVFDFGAAGEGGVGLGRGRVMAIESII